MREVAAKGIHVNAVACGMMETDMAQEALEKNRQQYIDRTPLGRIADPAEIAVAFTRVLRGAGVQVPTSSTIAFGEALGVLGIDDRVDIRRRAALHGPPQAGPEAAVRGDLELVVEAEAVDRDVAADDGDTRRDQLVDGPRPERVHPLGPVDHDSGKACVDLVENVLEIGGVPAALLQRHLQPEEETGTTNVADGTACDSGAGTCSAGVWLFYVQHQFEDVIWTRQKEWDYKLMALEGSSYLKFPRILQWFSGNIGFHHI